MDVYYKFQDVFHPLNYDSTSERNKEKVLREQMMTADFIGTLVNVKSADTKEQRDEMLREALSDRHKRFAPELIKILEAKTRREGNREVDSLLVLMYEYAAILAAVKAASSHEEVQRIIQNCLEY